MLKRKLCEAVIKWNLECEGPLLIADGRYSKDQMMNGLSDGIRKAKSKLCPDNFFVNKIDPQVMMQEILNAESNPPNGEWGFYVPGTSIRGPFRALGERIIRSNVPEDAPLHLSACDPFEQDETHVQTLGCSKRLETGLNGNSQYAEACPACKLFGCAGLASRIQFADAHIEQSTSVYRDMIGIDRFTGGVYKGSGGGGANMRFHVLENTRFSTTISVTNFELWQLGLLAYVFRDFEEGRVSIGAGKTKGFGKVKGTISEIRLTYPVSPIRIEHMGSLMSSATERDYYKIFTCDTPLFDKWDAVDDGLSLYSSVVVADKKNFIRIVAGYFNNYIEVLNHQIEENS